MKDILCVSAYGISLKIASLCSAELLPKDKMSHGKMKRINQVLLGIYIINDVKTLDAVRTYFAFPFKLSPVLQFLTKWAKNMESIPPAPKPLPKTLGSRLLKSLPS